MSETCMLFETDRLLVRWLTQDDLDMLFAVYSDAEAMRWVDDGQPITWEECKRWLEVTQKNYDTRGYGMSALVLKDLGRIIGFCGIVHPNAQVEPEIKYALLRDYWGQGLATEAVRGMLDYGATKQGLRRIIATIDPENEASHRVLQKTGMVHLKTEPDASGDMVKTMVWENV